MPALIASPPGTGAGTAVRLPTVLWFHGFRSDALAQAAELQRCAAAGFLAVGVDAVGHGARRDASIATRITEAPGGALEVMLSCVDATIEELPSAISALVAIHHADASRISAVGTSMGAFLIYRAIQRAVSWRAAVALLGSPEWPSAFGPSLTSVDAYRVPLLSVTASDDQSVPPLATRRFHERLVHERPVHDGHAHDRAPTPQAYHELAGSGHLTSAAHWAEAMHVTMSWLQQHAR
jgi:dienelactone hydrolase